MKIKEFAQKLKFSDVKLDESESIKIGINRNGHGKTYEISQLSWDVDSSGNDVLVIWTDLHE